MKTSERVDGPTPAGGVYMIAQYSDKEGNPVDKLRASHIEIMEYDKNDNVINTVYGKMSPVVSGGRAHKFRMQK